MFGIYGLHRLAGHVAAALVELRLPPMTLHTDNSAMIAAIGGTIPHAREGPGPTPLSTSGPARTG
ncbi:hypothetical protein ACFC0N_30240 [Streptomyces zaomyceticus]|uniref:hypothetical protein n=1 Tax=Streptomyces zaomyceticus TaxID=68286 RepID=UPI0035E20E1A